MTAGSRASIFVVLEGIDGAGTTTQLGRLCDHLTRRGRHALPTREPSSGPVGRLLREILLGQHALATGRSVSERTMALLFAADRRDHLDREIEPALAAGHDVVSDRYLLSSLAYQASDASDALLAWVRTLSEGVRRPDLTVLVDVPLEVAANRRRAAGRPAERYDEDRTLNVVRQAYRRLAAEDDRTVTVDGAGAIEQVAAAVAAAVDQLLDGARPISSGTMASRR